MKNCIHPLAHRQYAHAGIRWVSSILLVGMLLLLLVACGASSPSKPQGRKPLLRTSAPVFSKPITYVALGASDAVGVGSSSPGSQSYVALLSTRLPHGSHTLNLGISGIRLHEALSEELPLALDNAPRLVTIWLVTNDFMDGVSYQSYMDDLNNLLSQLHSRTQARLVMANLPDLTRLPIFDHSTASQKAQVLQKIELWDQGIAQTAKHYDVTLIDLLKDGSELTAHPNYISSDGFHPSAQGYARLADIFWQAIQTG